jgi:hypothetical protein
VLLRPHAELKATLPRWRLSSPTRRLTDRLHQTFDTRLRRIADATRGRHQSRLRIGLPVLAGWRQSLDSVEVEC